MSTTGTITIHPASAPGLTCTVEYPSGVTKEWREDTVRARGFDVPVSRATYGIVDGNGDLVTVAAS